MNVCFVCREYPPAPRTGGIGSATHDQAHALARLGHRVHVVAPAWAEPGTCADRGVVVHRVPVSGRQPPVLGRVFGQTLDRLTWSRAAARAVRRLRAAEGLDVVEVPEFAAEGFAATRHLSLPVVVRLHTPLGLVRRLNGTPLDRDSRATIRLERIALGRAAAVSAPSRAIAAACAEAGYGRRAAGATVIPWGTDTTVFCPGPSRRSRATAPVVLFVGRLEARKGVSLLLEAAVDVAARVPDVRLVFVGADTLSAPGGRSWQDWLRSVASFAGLGAAVSFAGFVPREELPAWYRDAAVVVVPSPFEAFGLVYLEAMACGRPVVGSAAGAFPEIASDGREAVLVPPGDARAIAKAVIDLLEDLDRAEAIGSRARGRAVERFSVERIARATAGFYQRVAHGGQ